MKQLVISRLVDLASANRRAAKQRRFLKHRWQAEARAQAYQLAAKLVRGMR